MRRFFGFLWFLGVFFVSSVMSDTTYKNIVAVTTESLVEAQRQADVLESRLIEDPEYRRLERKYRFALKARASGKLFIVTLEPFRNDSVMFKVLHKVQKSYPDSFVYTHWGEPIPPSTKVITEVITERAEPEIIILRSDPVPAPQSMHRALQNKQDEDDVSVTTLMLIAMIMLVLYVLWQQHKLQKAKKAQRDEHAKLEEIIEQQEDLMVNVSQKIQMPAKEINNSSEKIMQTKLSTVQVQELQKIQHSDELLLDITNDLIDFLNLKSGNLSVRNEVFNLNNVLDELAGQVSARSRGSKVELIFDIDKGVPSRLIGDTLRLGQILSNLLSNAMKYTNDGEVKMHVGRNEDVGNQVNLFFEISDTGIGIDDVRLETIFDPFSDLNDVKETGMGLYISRELARMMNGDITVSSQLGRGTRFVLTMRLSMPDPLEKRHYRLPSREFIDHSYLIIELQPTAADALKKMLEYFKNDVMVRSLLAIQNNSAPLFSHEVIVVAEDAFTPDLIAMIDKVKKRDNIRVVMAGKMLDMPHEIGNLESLVDARIMKPLNLQRVYDLIVDLFDHGDSRESTATLRYTKPTAFKAEESIEEVPDTLGVTKESFGIFAGAKLLLVEDNVINQKVILGLLKGSGINISVADNGLIGLEMVEDRNIEFDLVLMDINMPVMDGYESTRNIRANPIFDDLPIVSLTGLGLAEEIAKMYGIGMNAHLIKPLQIGQLYTIFKRYMPHSDIGTSAVQRIKFINAESLQALDGLRCASDDEALYLQILEQFVQLYASADDSLGAMLRTDDFIEARKLCLDVKGVASNIGAKKLAQIAARLHEDLGHREVHHLVDLSETFHVELQAVIADIKGYLV